MSTKFVVYGAQFGSEGKGAFAEYLIRERTDKCKPLLVIGENSPNSGHSNSKGKTRSLPVSAWYADDVLLGPDSAIDPFLLLKELEAIRGSRGSGSPRVFIHENAAMITDAHIRAEVESTLVERVASTTSGGGWARTEKARHRQVRDTIKHFVTNEWVLLDNEGYDRYLQKVRGWNWLFECSQGLHLDLNLGYYPSVTSRSTHPRCAIERNGLGFVPWEYYGVHRTFPIRTGGNSGPTGGREMLWAEVGVPQEIAVVTKRIRRVFEFSAADFFRGIRLVRPAGIAFTHGDYIKCDTMHPGAMMQLRDWLMPYLFMERHRLPYSWWGHLPFYLSSSPGQFIGPEMIFSQDYNRFAE